MTSNLVRPCEINLEFLGGKLKSRGQPIQNERSAKTYIPNMLQHTSAYKMHLLYVCSTKYLIVCVCGIKEREYLSHARFSIECRSCCEDKEKVFF